MLSPIMIAWLNVRGVESGLSCDIFRDVFVALSLDVFSISVFMLLILCAIEVMFFVVAVSLVSISWMWLFVSSDCVENSVWFDSSALSLLSMFATLRFVSVVSFMASMAVFCDVVAVFSACFAILDASSV